MLNITKGNVIPLRATLTVDEEDFYVINADDIEVHAQGLYRRFVCEYELDQEEPNVVYITVPATLTPGDYGIEVKGLLNGNSWRTYTSSVLHITYATEKTDKEPIIPLSDAYDISMEVQLYRLNDADALIEKHNEDEEAHPYIQGLLVQAKTLPEASEEVLGRIYQYVGESTEELNNGFFYQCIEEEGSYTWIQKNTQSGGGGEGDGTLPYDINVSRAVGGVNVGKLYPAGTPLAQIFKEMLSPTNYPTLTPPSASISANGAKLLEKGDTLNTVVTVTFSRGSINPAYGTSGYRSGVATGYSLNGGNVQSGNTFNVTVDEQHTVYSAKVNYEAGEQPKDSVGNDYMTPLPAGSVNTSSSLTYEFVDALWSNTSDIATVAKLPLVSKSARQYVFLFPAATAANPEAFDVPQSWNVTAVEVLNTLSNTWEDCSAEFTTTTTTHQNAASEDVNYVRYECNLGYAMADRKVRIKFN